MLQHSYVDKFGAIFPPSVEMSPNLVTLTEASTFSVSKRKRNLLAEFFCHLRLHFLNSITTGDNLFALAFFFVTGIHDLN
jgi:hypothetical protein